MTQKLKPTCDYICFSNLAYDSVYSDAFEIEQKIKRGFKYYNLGCYDHERVDHIRILKNDLYEEISLRSKSKYYMKLTSDYADLRDFDIEKMASDFSKKYPKIAHPDMNQMLNFAVYL